VARRRRRRWGGAWEGVFPPVNIVIANPHGAKRKLNWGVKKITGGGLNLLPPTILTLV